MSYTYILIRIIFFTTLFFLSNVQYPRYLIAVLYIVIIQENVKLNETCLRLFDPPLIAPNLFRNNGYLLFCVFAHHAHFGPLTFLVGAGFVFGELAIHTY